MDTRVLGRTGTVVGELGLGTEYLLNTSPANVTGVLHTALDHGVNFVDFFYAQAEIRDLMGAALRGVREDIVLGGHFGAAEEDGQYRKSYDIDESRRYFDDLLLRLGTDRVDVLYLHNVDSMEDAQSALGPWLEQVRTYRREGKARHIGFSGHTSETALLAVESGVVDVLMYPVHSGQHRDGGRDAVLSACAQHNVGLVAMKPFAGGKLLHAERPAGATPARLLAYSLSLPGVSTVVPGPKDVKELRECLAYIGAAPGDRDFSGILLDGDEGNGEDTCVYCNHCLPCPAGIDIGAASRILDAWEAGQEEWAVHAMELLEVKPEACTHCGGCKERCPWHIDSPDRMQRAAQIVASQDEAL